MLNLPDVTLVAMTSVGIEPTIKALLYSSENIKFGDIKLITDFRLPNIDSKIKLEYIDKISSIEQWNHDIIYKLGDYIQTDFAILIHADGFIVNHKSWRDYFLDYDYIGAPWPIPNDSFSFRDIDDNIIRVGNSVSLRSKRLIDLPKKLNMEWKAYHGHYNEDGFICVNNRHLYIKEGMRFADLDVAKYFSHETMIPEIIGIEPFAFHRHNGSNSKYPNFGK